MRVAVKTSLWVSVGLLVASEVPDDQSLVAGSREKHVRAGTMLALHCDRVPFEVALFKRGSQACNPAAVTLEGSAVDELLSHDGRTRLSGGLHKSCGVWRSRATANLWSSSGNFTTQLARTEALISYHGISLASVGGVENLIT